MILGWLYCLILLLLEVSSSAFIFQNDAAHPQCYELDLENCFREAFLAYLNSKFLTFAKRRPLWAVEDLVMSAVHPIIIHKRDLNVSNPQTRKSPRQIQICHDVRKFSACFLYPGCSDATAASVASTQYHMVFGKRLPMNVFLAYRGYGRQLCEQQCSKDNMLTCRKDMNDDEQQEEQGYLLEISSILGHIRPNKDTTVACRRFQKLLISLLRIRTDHCKDLVRCTCGEPSVQQGIDGCNMGCEHLLHLDLHSLELESSSFTGNIISLLLLPLFLHLMYNL